ncbi:hypothetical protein MHYP_G00283830 [Metynnis hypsauchen]
MRPISGAGGAEKSNRGIKESEALQTEWNDYLKQAGNTLRLQYDFSVEYQAVWDDCQTTKNELSLPPQYTVWACLLQQDMRHNENVRKVTRCRPVSYQGLGKYTVPAALSSTKAVHPGREGKGKSHSPAANAQHKLGCLRPPTDGGGGVSSGKAMFHQAFINRFEKEPMKRLRNGTEEASLADI